VEEMGRTVEIARQGILEEINSTQTKVFSQLCEQDALSMEIKYACERIENTYQSMKKDVARHESLCFEIARKFEGHHDVM
jgi:SMC interacting uncharacterized protein involved in chromosome segregation